MSAMRWLLAGSVCVVMAMAPNAVAGSAKAKGAHSRSVERGRYVVKIGGCNDCHTPGYGETGGKVPESKWLVGSPLGWRGPWGTTYPPNLRVFIPTMSEDQWVKFAKTTELRPPMPWFALHDMTKRDLRAIYRFVRYLGPAGGPAPAFVPPGKDPKGPFVQFPSPPPAK